VSGSDQLQLAVSSCEQLGGNLRVVGSDLPSICLPHNYNNFNVYQNQSSNTETSKTIATMQKT